VNPINLTALVALVISVSLFPAYIAWLKRKQIGQFIREEGPQSHAVKAKTPTMGGLCLMLVSATVATAFLFTVKETAVVPFNKHAALVVIAAGVLCGLVGFADDYGKVTSKSNRGLSARTRLIIEFSLGLLLSGLLFGLNAAPTSLIGFGSQIPLTGIWQGVYLLAVVPFLVASSTNAINLHDGMDGLAGGTSAQVFTILFLILLSFGHLYLAAVCAAMVGALVGFLVYNRYPAKVFMGDTGSLYIGGIIGAVVAASGLLIWFIPLSLLYIAETISVMLQVTYFKLTKEWTPPTPMSQPAIILTKLTKRLPGEGKRLFRMAPLHHHFEAVAQDNGQPEWQVVAYFWIAQLVLCLLTWLLFEHFFKLG
jgi:phospho-N-acetylmuramoyl-pentapeptide-transferase